MLTIDKDFLSLTVGRWEKLNSNHPAVWHSDNRNIFVNGNGWVLAVNDYLYTDDPNGRAVITASAGGETATCDVTIVSWPANRVKLDILQGLGNYGGPVKDGDVIYYGDEATGKIFATEDFVTINEIGELPTADDEEINAKIQRLPFLITPYGYFFRHDVNIYKSTDWVNWSHCYTTAKPSVNLVHTFDWYYDGEYVYVYTVDYSGDEDHRHSVYRGVIAPDGSESWGIVKEFYSRNEGRYEGLEPCCRHLHVVTVDKSTGDVWIGTGDVHAPKGVPYSTNENYIMRSQDNGETWTIIGEGSQIWRVLAIWFSDKYVYWNMDTTVPQYIYRLKIDSLSEHSPENDLKEIAAPLYDGSQWHILWIKNHKNEDAVIMGVAQEGMLREPGISRAFMFVEKPDGRFIVDEIMALKSRPPGEYQAFARMNPFVQDKHGKIYPAVNGIDGYGNRYLIQTELVEVEKIERRVWRNTIQFKS